LICPDGVYFASWSLRNSSIDEHKLHHKLPLVPSWCNSTAKTNLYASLADYMIYMIYGCYHVIFYFIEHLVSIFGELGKITKKCRR
jgi:hypothetical protein